MSTMTLPAEARAFADAVRAELADLPEEDAAELLEDVEQHLAEAVADGRLAELGSPAAYAAELRAAAGLPARQAAALSWAPVRTARRWWARLAATRAYGEVRAFAPELRPGWWVLRGYLAAVALAFWTHSSLHQVLPVPHVSGSALLGLVVTGAAVVASVAWGRRRTGYGRRQRWLAIAVNTVALVVGLAVLDTVSNAGYDVHYVETAYPPQDGLHGPYGQVNDIYAYDSEGRPLDGVLLFDEEGHAIAPQVCGSFCPRLSFPLHESDEQRAPVAPDSPFHLRPAPSAVPTVPPSPSAAPAKPSKPSPSATPSAKRRR